MDLARIYINTKDRYLKETVYESVKPSIIKDLKEHLKRGF
jgi:hypothetical protein